MSFQFVQEAMAYSEDPLVNSQYLSVANFARWIRQFESSNYTLASCSWQQREFYDFLLTYNKPVLLFNCFDPMFNGNNNTPLAHYIEKLNRTKHVRVVGNNLDDYLNYWCLGFAPEGQFKNYLQDDFLKYNFEKVFLCYQRSNTGYREKLYDALKCYNKYGTVTYAQIVNKKISVLNDINTVGELNIWNSHFLNIISETQYDWQNPYQIFLSEKTWKPIYGMRPFLHFTNVYANDFLKSQGFELFWEDFGCVYDNNKSWSFQIKQITQAVENLKNKNLNSFYKKLLPKIKHNRINLNKFIQRQKDKIEAIKHIPFPSSSVVEQTTVNRLVGGSNPS